jgi:hypothetical protein
MSFLKNLFGRSEDDKSAEFKAYFFTFGKVQNSRQA